jgi:CRISPR-associated protein (TIGR03984 family)
LNPTIRGITSSSQSQAADVEQLLELVHQEMPEGSYAYAVMDHAVAVGLWSKGRLLLGYGETCEVKELIDWDYIQELRIFCTQKELRMVRMDGCFAWRLRVDEPLQDGVYIDVLDETHKLWGHADGSAANGWTLLGSQRGSRIYFPSELSKGEERGLIIRNYISFELGDLTDSQLQTNPNLYRYVDERFVDFVAWPMNENGV